MTLDMNDEQYIFQISVLAGIFREQKKANDFKQLQEFLRTNREYTKAFIRSGHPFVPFVRDILTEYNQNLKRFSTTSTKKQ